MNASKPASGKSIKIMPKIAASAPLRAMDHSFSPGWGCALFGSCITVVLSEHPVFFHESDVHLSQGAVDRTVVSLYDLISDEPFLLHMVHNIVKTRASDEKLEKRYVCET